MRTGVRLLAVIALIAGQTVIGAGSADASIYRCINSRDEGIHGTDGPDVLVGTPAADIIHAGAGDDEIAGLGGIDLICAGSGNDTIEGNKGEDTLVGGGGNDTIYGGDHGDWIFPMAGDDVVDGGAHDDSIFMSTADGPVTVDLAAGTAAGEGNDALVNVETVWGSRHGSTMLGDAAHNSFWTEGPDNTIVGRGGSDRIHGLNGGTQDLSGNRGHDEISAFGNGPDFVSGGPGNDEIRGSGGQHTIDGDDGNDSIEIERGPVEIDGGEGVDYLEISLAEKALNVDLEAGTIAGGVDGSVMGIEKARTGFHDDIVTGDAGPNRLAGRVGEDLLSGRPGNDELEGYWGDDSLRGGDGDDVLDGGKDYDRVRGRPGWDSCRGEVLKGCEATEASDPDDTRGPLDVKSASARLVEQDGVRAIDLSFTSHKRFEDGEVEIVRFLLGGGAKEGSRRMIYVSNPRPDRLRANLVSSSGRLIARLEVTRPDPRSLALSLPVDLLPEGVGDEYSWDLFTMSDARGCWREDTEPMRNRCRDGLPTVNASISP